MSTIERLERHGGDDQTEKKAAIVVSFAALACSSFYSRFPPRLVPRARSFSPSEHEALDVFCVLQRRKHKQLEPCSGFSHAETGRAMRATAAEFFFASMRDGVFLHRLRLLSSSWSLCFLFSR